MYSGESRNPWNQPDPTFNNESRIHSLKKAIREQKILLEATNSSTGQDDEDTTSLQELKARIRSVSQELNEKNKMSAMTTGRSNIPWSSRYQQNLRQLEDIADQKQTLQKELDYLVGTSIRKLKDDLLYETERLNSTKLSMSSQANNSTNDFHNMTEAERIRAKAQAMVAARLNKSTSTSTRTRYDQDDERTAAQQRIQQINALMDAIHQSQREVDYIIENNLSLLDHDVKNGASQLKDKQMFEQGLFVSDELAIFIDSLDRRHPSPSIPPLPISSSYTSNRSTLNHPPPIPTSQRPGTPRSEADIKAEAHRRIEQRRKLFIKETVKQTKREDPPTNNEEKVAQERMRQAEADARARLEAMREKRNQIRQEAAETEEKRKQAAAEAAAAAEAEMQREKERQQREEEERQAKLRRQQEEEEERQRKRHLEEMQRARKEAEEREKRESEERLKREAHERAEEELRQSKARQAAEQAAREKRLRREEIERREREMEAARQEEINRRKKWEAEERQRQLEEQQKIQAKLEEEERIRRHIEEEALAAQKRKEEEEERERQLQLEEERKRKREEEENRLRQERKRREEEQKKKKEQEEQLRKEEEERWLQQQREEEYKRAQESAYSPHVGNATIQNNLTAGTSGYGIDVEDEVNFSIIYRVVTLYEYQGIREDDLSFNANETIKAHPSKDKSSDWWYGTSLVTNQIGFFPRTYVEVIEEAFRVKTLYQFNKTRPDDLEFSENEVILVQPFQDEQSDWWYGTNEDTNESGYFPKSYVERIDSATPQIHVNAPNHVRPISIQKTPTSSSLSVIEEPQRGLSAPNTPIMKKTHLNVNKIDITKRRRAASTVSSADNSHIGTPTLFPSSNNAPESLALVTWASTMDPIELQAISPEERKRQEAIFELISTERSYLNDLQMIINVFYTDSGKYLTQDERDVVFSNIDDLLICNTALLSDLESRQRDGANVVDKIGDVFLAHADSLQCYSTYCRNQSYASKFLQKKREDDQWFEVFLKTTQTRLECRSLDLSHFLLQPVQRITRYPLLLRHILNSTPKRHADYALVKSALSIAQKVLEDVNEETRRFENQQKMSELSRILDMDSTWRLNVPGREIVMDGALYKAKSGRKLHGYLFNDLLILAEPMKTLSNKGYLYCLYREPMPVGKVTVRQQPTMTLKPTFGANNSDDAIFQIVYDNNIIAVKASSAAQKRQWINQIQHFSALQQYGA